MWRDFSSAAQGIDVTILDRGELGDLAARIGSARAVLDGLEARIAVALRRLGASEATTAETLRRKTGCSAREARHRARRAETLDQMPNVAEALSSGRLTGEHVSALARAAAETSPEAVDSDLGLLAAAEAVPADLASHKAKDWARQQQTGDDLDRLHQWQRRNRSLNFAEGHGGMLNGIAKFDRVSGAQFQALVGALADRLYRADGGRDNPGARSRAQCRHDALLAQGLSGPLVLTRVSCVAVVGGLVGPFEGLGSVVVVVDVVEDGSGEVAGVAELGGVEELAGEDGEPRLDLVEPGGVGGGAVREDAVVVVEELLDGGGAVGGEVVDGAVQLEVRGDLDSRSARNVTKFVERVESVGMAVTLPVAHSNAANSATVPWRRYSNSCWAGRPAPPPPTGRAARVGFVRLLACIPVFSSTLNTAQLSAGCKYSPQTSTALASKSWSWDVIQERTCHGLRPIDLQIRHTWESEIAIPRSSRSRRATSGIDMRALRRRPPSWPGSAGRVVIVLTSASLSCGPYTAGRPDRGLSPSASTPPST